MYFGDLLNSGSSRQTWGVRVSVNRSLRAGWTAAVALLAIATMLGCQAVSTSANQGTKQGGAVSLSNSTLDFGSVTVGASKTLTVSLVNGTSSEILITAAAISDAEFSLSAPAIPAIVNAGQSLPLSIAFKPKATGTPSGMVSITTNTQNLVTLSVSGKGTSTAVGQLAMVPANMSFGNVQTGSSQSQSATLTNTGSATVNISSGECDRHRVQHQRTQCAVDVRAGCQCLVHHKIRSCHRRNCFREHRYHQRRVQFPAEHTSVWHGSRAGHPIH